MTAATLLAPASASVLTPTSAEAATPTGWTTVVNRNSGRCVDAAAAATANATTAQQWQLLPTDGGYVRIANANDPAKVWDVTGVSTADGPSVQLWAWGGGANQQWLPVDEGGGSYRFVNRNSGKCLDVPSAATADSVVLQQYACNGTAAQSFSFGAGSDPGNPGNPGNPDLGPNVAVFDPSMPAATVQAKLNSVFQQQETNQFGAQRYALLFKPGTYDVDANVGFYTQVAGLGLTPDAVTINGGVHAEADWFQGNATQNFWRSAEGLSVNPPSGTDRWAVSQAAPYRRMHVRGNLQLDDGGWSSGGLLADSLIDGQFHVVKPGATAAQINAALGQGKHLLVTPGVYHLDQTLNVTRPDTVVLGLGLATLIPDNGIAAMTVADVDGGKITGVLFDAGPVNSPVLLQLGPAGSAARHTADPASLHDVFFRIGGAGVGRATQSLVINSSDVIGDRTWIWRADHGSGVGWTTNTAATGLTVNGTAVTMYGLFVEHYQQHQVVWNGNGGRTYFFQNEMPYDPPNQTAWQNGPTRGYAAYKVADSVTSHEAWGLGSYCYFNVNPGVVAEHAIEAHRRSGVRFHDMVTVSLGGTGTIAHVVNSTGGPSNSATNVADLVSHP